LCEPGALPRMAPPVLETLPPPNWSYPAPHHIRFGLNVSKT
jgi:hypothetical protein